MGHVELEEAYIFQMAIKGIRSVGKPNCCCTDDIVGQQGAVWMRIAKDKDSWRTPVVGYFLQWKDTV